MPNPRYSVVEIFATLQGEGMQSGRAAVFVRLGGCNLWSGEEEHRVRDLKRKGAACALFCDTDFRSATMMSLKEITQCVSKAALAHGFPRVPLVVLTGGEPLLQVDASLLGGLKDEFSAEIAVETNGSVPAKEGVAAGLDWICVSPKLPDASIKIRRGHELKIVVPNYDPSSYEDLARGFRHTLVQPCAETTEVGVSTLSDGATQAAIEFCQQHPSWRLSLQTHKILHLP